MVRSLLPLGAILLGASTVVLADQATCSLAKRCPEETPCCSQYGQCGIGAYCLGGCDPRMSFTLDSCTPAPVCQSKTYTMENTDRILDVSKYLGDPDTADWVAQGEPLSYNGNVLLTMPANSVGTVLASTTYMWYGSVKAKLKTSRGAGVVTAFILFSDVKDEIDYEWVGADLTVAQTNYYFQGIPEYVNSGNITGVSDTFNNFHDYEIHWTPDNITWLVDGVVGRVKQRSETWNATANQWNFPQTPARVQLSIWPGGASSNAQGTIDWAGGAIDWSSSDIKNYGYDFATVGEITVECWDAQTPPGTNLHVSYTYDNILALNNSVIDGTKRTNLKSFQGTGTDMDAGDTSNSKSSTGTAAKATVTAATIPGGDSSGPGSGPAESSDVSSSSATSTVNTAACQATGFSQNGCDDSSSTSATKNAGVRTAERMLGGGALAALLAVAGLFLL